MGLTGSGVYWRPFLYFESRGQSMSKIESVSRVQHSTRIECYALDPRPYITGYRSLDLHL